MPMAPHHRASGFHADVVPHAGTLPLDPPDERHVLALDLSRALSPALEGRTTTPLPAVVPGRALGAFDDAVSTGLLHLSVDTQDRLPRLLDPRA